MTSGDLTFDLTKKLTKVFSIIFFNAPSIASYRVSLRGPGAELEEKRENAPPQSQPDMEKTGHQRGGGYFVYWSCGGWHAHFSREVQVLLGIGSKSDTAKGSYINPVGRGEQINVFRLRVPGMFQFCLAYVILPYLCSYPMRTIDKQLCAKTISYTDNYYAFLSLDGRQCIRLNLCCTAMTNMVDNLVAIGLMHI